MTCDVCPNFQSNPPEELKNASSGLSNLLPGEAFDGISPLSLKGITLGVTKYAVSCQPRSPHDSHSIGRKWTQGTWVKISCVVIHNNN